MLLLVRWARARRPIVAATLLAALFAGPMVLPHADPLGDVACSTAPMSHDAGAHGVGAAPSGHTEHGQHCFTCHAARAFSCLLRIAGPLDRSAERIERLRRTDSAARTTLSWALLPERAPPV
jgi:mono/diheme cytochrome c family protein